MIRASADTVDDPAEPGPPSAAPQRCDLRTSLITYGEKSVVLRQSFTFDQLVCPILWMIRYWLTYLLPRPSFSFVACDVSFSPGPSPLGATSLSAHGVHTA